MASQETPATLVARFLRTNSYDETLDAFLKEANLPLDTGSSFNDALTIEQVLTEKKTYDLSQSFEKVDLQSGEQKWSTPAPSKADVVSSLANPSNILHISADELALDIPDPEHRLLVSTASKVFAVLSDTRPFEVLRSTVLDHGSPVLSWIVVRNRYVFTSSMSGHVALLDLRTMRQLWCGRDHQKYVVTLAHYEDEEGLWLATAAWDAKVLLYRFNHDSMAAAATGGSAVVDSEPLATVTLATNPESLLFIEHPELAQPILVLSRKDSTFLYYYAIPDGLPTTSTQTNSNADTKTRPTLPLLGRQNLAPHSNAWIAFTPSAFALHPSDPSLIAVATSHTPHMKLLLARLLLPPPTGEVDPLTSATAPPVLDATSGPIVNPTQASEARRLLAIQDREDAAIVLQMSTMAPQTAYSTPALAWRPDGTGVWVNGDDGVVRGVETKTGKVVSVLKGGHEAGSKVRCLWAGTVGKEEWVVSGGFDRRLIVWKC